MSLLERVARGNGGNPQRTIAALRLINQHLKRELTNPSSQLVIRFFVRLKDKPGKNWKTILSEIGSEPGQSQKDIYG